MPPKIIFRLKFLKNLKNIKSAPLKKMVIFFFQNNHIKNPFLTEKSSSMNGLPPNLGDRQRISQSEGRISLAPLVSSYRIL
jgi:hypothetical protein